ncbi:toll/interleukin-1 receptor domain-containing protein [Streptomyces sp. A1547]|uniref:toll/interleukin-1 receptor domain-containing protein n=1 Tax=Streptomyces sp. A1547 TaxID=2563105 RepID=UPI00109EA11B|nr:toll/interleukin-1 receptor domain-containing protein [Streptomyces sp. A1547]THA30527.1 toll/interleukin-1 receptor domain-containing protein [Streptomyces sp. A1547]
MQEPRHRTAREELRAIFISYRRSDSAPWAGRLAADLRKYVGKERIYLDIDSNLPARDYVVALEQALLESRVVIAVLGPQWSNSLNDQKRRRLDDSSDLVRVEIETALQKGIALIPVLVGGATMPPAHELPSSLQTLTRLQAVRLADEDWPYDFGRLLETLERYAVLPASEAEAVPPNEVTLLTTTRYERTLQASRRRAFDALTGAVELLRYPIAEVSPEAAMVMFNARRGGVVSAEVVDADPGYSVVVLKLPSAKMSAVVGASVALAFFTSGISLAAGPALWAWQRRFAVGFLDNVEGVLEGRGVGEDSSLLPGIHAWRTRRREI